MKSWRFWITPLGLGVCLLASLGSEVAALAEPRCFGDRIALVTQLLRDLPAYANRANTQLGIPQQYVIVTSRPEFQPLLLGAGQRATPVKRAIDREDPYQIFFTTLERSYQNGKIAQLQHYHWLFLTHTDSGWRLALMYSIIGPYKTEGPALPPRNSSEGSLAQAIRTWLRDYRSDCGPGPNEAV